VSKWKHKNKSGGKSGGMVSGLSFVFSCKISKEALGLTHLRKILDKVMWSMKAQPNFFLGKILWDHCKREEDHIVKYLMN
jgi:hypothetical protein